MIVVSTRGARERAHRPGDGIDDRVGAGVVLSDKSLSQAVFAELLTVIIPGFGEPVRVEQQALGGAKVQTVGDEWEVRGDAEQRALARDRVRGVGAGEVEGKVWPARTRVMSRPLRGTGVRWP